MYKRVSLYIDYIFKELQQQLEHEKQQHDYELTAIQNFHTQQLEAIKSNHQQEVEKLKSESFPARDGKGKFNALLKTFAHRRRAGFGSFTAKSKKFSFAGEVTI